MNRKECLNWSKRDREGSCSWKDRLDSGGGSYVWDRCNARISNLLESRFGKGITHASKTSHDHCPIGRCKFEGVGNSHKDIFMNLGIPGLDVSRRHGEEWKLSGIGRLRE